MFLLLGSCKSSDQIAEEAAENQAFDQLSELVASGNFTIEIDVAQPFNTAATTAVLNDLAPYMNGSNTNNINIQGNGHFIEMADNKVKANMPYFGQQFQGGAGTLNRRDVGVDIDMEPRDLEQRTDTKRKRIEVEFSAIDTQSKAENYNVLITAFANNKATVLVTSSQRTNIRYLGRIIPSEAKP